MLYDVVDVFVEFVFLESGNEYLDLRRSCVYFKFKMIKLDGMVLVNLEKKWGLLIYFYSFCFFRLMNILMENVLFILLIIICGRFI